MSTESISRSFTVVGMSCSNCEKHVREAVQSVKGVGSVQVDLQGGRATVSFDPRATTAAAIVAAITEAGYEATEAANGGASGRW
jgi:copper chaperone CopZ